MPNPFRRRKPTPPKINSGTPIPGRWSRWAHPIRTWKQMTPASRRRAKVGGGLFGTLALGIGLGFLLRPPSPTEKEYTPPTIGRPSEGRMPLDGFSSTRESRPQPMIFSGGKGSPKLSPVPISARKLPPITPGVGSHILKERERDSYRYAVQLAAWMGVQYGEKSPIAEKTLPDFAKDYMDSGKIVRFKLLKNGSMTNDFYYGVIVHMSDGTWRVYDHQNRRGVEIGPQFQGVHYRVHQNNGLNPRYVALPESIFRPSK